MSDNSSMNSAGPSEAPSGATPPTQAPSVGRLKISLRGKVVASANPTSTAQPSPRSGEQVFPIHSVPSTVQAPPPPQPPVELDVPVIQPAKNVDDKDREMQWRAESLLNQILAPRGPAYDFVPPAAAFEGLATITLHRSDELSEKRPMSQQEALLMVSALKVLGKPDYAKLLLPSSISEEASLPPLPSSTTINPQESQSTSMEASQRMDISPALNSLNTHPQSASTGQGAKNTLNGTFIRSHYDSIETSNRPF